MEGSFLTHAWWDFLFNLQVEDMSVQLAKKQVVVDQSQKACEELLVEIVSGAK